MPGPKRRTTKPGMGAVRGSRSSEEPSTERQGINVPEPRQANADDATSPPSSARGTLKRSPSDSTIRAKAIPKVNAAAKSLEGKELEPADAFLLSHIDGQLDVTELADLTGMSEKDVIASLKRLLVARLISV